MRESTKDKISRLVTITLIALTLVVGLMFAWPTYLRSKSLQRQSAELSQRIQEKHAEIAKLAEYQKRFKTDREFVEAIARQNRRVYPGELVFVFDEKTR